MLNPENLRKKSQDAAHRIEQERLREEERLRQLEEARKLEAVRREIEEKRERESRILASKQWEKILTNSIKVASNGGRSIQFEISSDLIPLLRSKIESAGAQSSLFLRDNLTSSWALKVERRLSVLAEKIRNSPYAESYMERLGKSHDSFGVEGLDGFRRHVVCLLSEIEKKPEKDESYSSRELRFSLPEDARNYIKLQINPILYLDEDSSDTKQLEIFWEPKDVVDFVLNELHQVPSWLLSTGGSGLLQRMSICMNSDADQGKNESVFELYSLPVNPGRWGQNTMTKFVHADLPIGVCPFPKVIFTYAMRCMGFKAIAGKGLRTDVLTVRW